MSRQRSERFEGRWPRTRHTRASRTWSSTSQTPVSASTASSPRRRTNAVGEWRELASSPIGQTLGSCVALGETAYPYEFDTPTPCPLSLSAARLSFDTAQLPAGTHDFRVAVIDAAGNRTEVIPARRFHDSPRLAGRAGPESAAARPPDHRSTSAKPRGSAGVRAARKARRRQGRPARRRAADDPHPPVLPEGGRLLRRVVDARPRHDTGQRLVQRSRARRSVPLDTDQHGGRSRDSPPRSRRSMSSLPRGCRASSRLARPQSTPGAHQRRVAGPIPIRRRARDARGPPARAAGFPSAPTKRWVRTRPSGTFTLSSLPSNLRPTTYRFRVVADESHLPTAR